MGHYYSKAAASAGCTVAHETSSSSNSSGVGISNGALGGIRLGFPFTADSTSIRCAAELYLDKVGTSADTMWTEIYADDGGGASNLPTGSPLGTSSDTRPISDAADAGALLKFNNMSVSVISGTIYWLVLRVNTNDNANRPTMLYENGGTTRRFAYYDGASWVYWVNRKPTFTLYATS